MCVLPVKTDFSLNKRPSGYNLQICIYSYFVCSSWDRRSVMANFIPTVDDSTPIDSPCSVEHGQFLDRLGIFFSTDTFYLLSVTFSK